MGILNIFGKKSVAEQGWRVGGMEDFMTLIRVYYQAVMAANLGINNLAALPDLRLFKQTLHVPTVNNKLGLGEKNRCKKLLSEIYGISDNFFKEIDMSIKRNCKNLNSVQPYFFAFQGFSQELMMVMGNLMKWKFRVPGFMKNALRTMTQKTVNDVLDTAANGWRNMSITSLSWLRKSRSQRMLRKKTPRNKPTMPVAALLILSDSLNGDAISSSACSCFKRCMQKSNRKRKH